MFYIVKHEIPFAFIINDFEEFGYNFSKNEEGKLIKGIIINNLKNNKEIIDNLCLSSAGSLKLYQIQMENLEKYRNNGNLYK